MRNINNKTYLIIPCLLVLFLVGLITKYGYILSVLGIASFIDFKKRIVPNTIILCFLPAVLIDFNLNNFLGLIPAFIFLIVGCVDDKAIGGGDIKLIAVLGLCLGFYKCLLLLMVGVVFLIAFHLLFKKSKYYPLVPFIFIGTYITYLWR